MGIVRSDGQSSKEEVLMTRYDVTVVSVRQQNQY